ncbi:hypothetical protein Q4Q35_05435 [Flavivirga aquimarina]|uniref:RGS domain-containing protein n=1 Tax=Flavivirga aquimarina TaxID=2027862 RepID=A0ABT8W7Y9_9FLAO|nr:hypothetical protein [Flavivirga aquimarina]MDO5969244.1 hypothetical protein [Flavivirga aquimarina]
MIIIISQSFYGQVSDLLLIEKEKQYVIQKILQEKNSDATTSFIKKAQQANISKSEIDSLLIAKETYLYLQKRIQNNAKLRDSLFLFSENKGTLKRENFNMYRKKLTDILSQKQFYNLYKDIIDAKSKLAVKHKMNEVVKTYKVEERTRKELLTIIEPLYKDICLAEVYYNYDKKLAQYEKYQLEKRLALKVEEKIKRLGLQKAHTIFDSSDSKVIDFIKTARSLKIKDSLIVEITNRIEDLNQQLENSKKSQGVSKPEYLYTLYDDSLDSSDAYRAFENYVTSVLTQNQYQWLFWDQLKPKIDQMSRQRFVEFSTRYNLDDFNNKGSKLLQQWIHRYVTEEVIANRYYAHESSLASVKVKLVKTKADKKYKEIIEGIIKKPTIEINVIPRVKDFLANAAEQGVDIEKTHKILQACLEYELKQEEIMVLKKYNKTTVYSLENDDKKIQTRDSFRYFLTKNLTKEEYRKLFWKQLKPEIDARVKSRLNKVRETYPKIKGSPFEELHLMIQNQVTNETVAKYYYSYDKKIAKQKVKALNYKFNKEYKEKIKQNKI